MTPRYVNPYRDALYLKANPVQSWPKMKKSAEPYPFPHDGNLDRYKTEWPARVSRQGRGKVPGFVRVLAIVHCALRIAVGLLGIATVVIVISYAVLFYQMWMDPTAGPWGVK